MRQRVLAALAAFAAGAACLTVLPAQAAEPTGTLIGRAVLPAATFGAGPVSGTNIGPGPFNGLTPPFRGQPVQGFSALIQDGAPGRYLALSDNGYGAKNNSADFLLRAHKIRPNFTTGAVSLLGFIGFSDPKGLAGQPLTRADRQLTGADFDPESIRRVADGTYWVGEEFGPSLLHFSATGELLRAPVRFPVPARLSAYGRGRALVTSPDAPELAASATVTVGTTPAPTASPTASASPRPTGSAHPTMSASPRPTGSAYPTMSAHPTMSASPTTSPTTSPTPRPTGSPTSSAGPTVAPTASATPTVSPTPATPTAVLAANLPRSRGIEGMALSTDGTTLYPSLEGALVDDPDQRRRVVYSFDVATERFRSTTADIRLSAPGNAIGDLTAAGPDTLLVIERDNEQGAAARTKDILLVDIAPFRGYLPQSQLVDLLRLANPSLIGGPAATSTATIGLGAVFGFPFQTIESLYVQDRRTLVVANDNNFPFSSGRRAGAPDDNEIIQIRLPEALPRR